MRRKIYDLLMTFWFIFERSVSLEFPLANNPDSEYSIGNRLLADGPFQEHPHRMPENSFYLLFFVWV